MQWTYTSQVILYDGEDLKLPTWVDDQPFQPPSRSTLLRRDVFENLQAEGAVFDVYADKKMKQIKLNYPI